MAIPLVGILGRLAVRGAAGAIKGAASAAGGAIGHGPAATGYVRIEGEKETMRVLKEFGQPFQEQALLAAVMEGAKIIENEARARAPYGKKGRLRDNMMSERLKQAYSDRHQVAVGTSWRVRDGVSRQGAASQHPAFYGIMIEKGTRNRFRKKWRRKSLRYPAWTGRGRADPFLEPAWDAKKGAAQRQIKNRISRLIRQKLRKAGRRG
jgi:hypothetical protein